MRVWKDVSSALCEDLRSRRRPLASRFMCVNIGLIPNAMASSRSCIIASSTADFRSFDFHPGSTTRLARSKIWTVSGLPLMSGDNRLIARAVSSRILATRLMRLSGAIAVCSAILLTGRIPISGITRMCVCVTVLSVIDGSWIFFAPRSWIGTLTALRLLS